MDFNPKIATIANSAIWNKFDYEPLPNILKIKTCKIRQFKKGGNS